MTLSIIIVSHNRSNDLKEVIECLKKQKISDPNMYEILVVDNASTDNTKSTVENLLNSFNGKLQYYYESRKGKPYGMNLGIQQSKGEYIYFTDDDCLFDECLITNILSVLKTLPKDIGFIGGKITPHWLTQSRPKWLTDEFMGPLAMLNYGDKSFVIDKSTKRLNSKLFYGANLLVRKDLFDRFGLIDEKRTFSQDTELCLRLLNNNIKGLYSPDIKVSHKVSAKRLTPQYFYDWYYKRGQYCQLPKSHSKKFYHPFGVPFWLWKKTFTYLMLSFFLFLVPSSTSKRIIQRCNYYYNLRFISELIKSQKSPQRLNA